VPGIIAGVLVVWPCLEDARGFRVKECSVFLSCLLILTINSLVFDYRDIAGDAAFGTRTLPIRLGRRNTIYLLLVLVAAVVGVNWWLAGNRLVSPSMPSVLVSGSAGLLLVVLGQFRPMTITAFDINHSAGDVRTGVTCLFVRYCMLRSRGSRREAN
jgi:UbiA prenyltransferase family